MSMVVSLELEDDQLARLERVARTLGRAPAEAAALLLEESLRVREFPWIEFRDTILGREAFIAGTRFKVWMLVDFVRAFDDDPEQVAAHLGVPVPAVESALRYAAAFPDEIETAIAENDPDIEELKQIMPGLIVVRVDASAP